MADEPTRPYLWRVRSPSHPPGSPEPILDLNWVTSALAVGARWPMEHVAHVARLGVRAVVDVREEERDDEALLVRHGLGLLHLPTPDTRAIPLPLIHRGVRWVGERLDRGEKVLIHCQHGVGRSALLTVCVLVSRGEAPLEALERAKAARWQVSPSPEQLQAFLQFAAECRAREGRCWELPRFEALCAIAYRHLVPSQPG